MTNPRSLFRRLSLRSVLFFVLLLSGILPLVLSGALLLLQNRGLLQNAERDVLIREVGALSRQVDADLVATRRELTLVGQVLLATPGPDAAAGVDDVIARLDQPWVAPYL